MSYQVIDPFLEFTNPANGQPIGIGSVYFGRPDSDPKNQPSNRINVYAVQDNGTEVLLSQPITLNAAGQPQYNGSPKQLRIELAGSDTSYCVQVFDKNGAQKLYTARVVPAVDLVSLASQSSQVVVGGATASELGQSYVRRMVFAPLVTTNTAAQNSAILQSKIDYARTLLDSGFYGGVEITLPQGQFDFEGVEIKRGVAGIVGAGLTATALNLVGANKTGFYCKAFTSGLAADQVDYGYFKNFTIQPKTPNITAPTGQVMWNIIGFSRWNTENVYVGWCSGAIGIQATGGVPASSGGPAQWHNTFINCYVQKASSWPAGGVGWLIGDTSLSFEQVTTWDIIGGRTSGGNGTGTGFNFQSCNTIALYNHAIEGCSITIGNHGGARIAENVCFIPAYFEGSNTCTIGSKASNTNFIGEFITGYTIVDTSGTLNRVSPTNFQTRCGNTGTEDWVVNIVSPVNRRPKFNGTATSGIDIKSNTSTTTIMNTGNISPSYEQLAVYLNGATGTFLLGAGAAGIVFLTDGVGTVGSAANRCSTVYATTGTINTSDEREKTELLEADEAEKAAALEIKQHIRKFKFKDAVNKKGEAARIHFGVGAQTVKSIMERHGLKPEQYAFFCFDEWNDVVVDIPARLDEAGGEIEPAYQAVRQKAGTRYGIRYDELAMFILGAI